MANSNKRYNTIDSLHIDGVLSSDPVAIREHAANYFESMFAESLSWRPKLDELEFDSLSEDEAASLDVWMGIKLLAWTVSLWLFFKHVGRC